MDAWQSGDLRPLAELIDPAAEFLTAEPAPWDCYGRAAILALLALCIAEGRHVAWSELVEAGDNCLVVSRRADDDGPGVPSHATHIRFRAGKVVLMRQYGSREEALAAAK